MAEPSPTPAGHDGRMMANPLPKSRKYAARRRFSMANQTDFLPLRTRKLLAIQAERHPEKSRSARYDALPLFEGKGRPCSKHYDGKPFASHGIPMARTEFRAIRTESAQTPVEKHGGTAFEDRACMRTCCCPPPANGARPLHARARFGLRRRLRNGHSRRILRLGKRQTPD